MYRAQTSWFGYSKEIELYRGLSVEEQDTRTILEQFSI